ncbi:hypothetical protein JHFBIEKO_5635 [Methylobacterium mesophilicum]|nr:hypothetical protein JHFBIEKO_5635 [Methylobacterium mesophilicum]
MEGRGRGGSHDEEQSDDSLHRFLSPVAGSKDCRKAQKSILSRRHLSRQPNDGLRQKGLTVK